MTRNLILLAPLALLAACGTPQEQCIRGNTSELRTLTRLLAETEGNLSRGYAWGERQTWETEWQDCRRIRRDRDGNARVYYEPCLRNVPVTERFRVPIDPQIETRKRDNLAAKVREQEARAKQVITACQKAYPEG